MKKQTRFIDARRRGFLKGAAVASTAAASGGALATEGVSLTETDSVITPESKGYRATDHVRTYYDRARF